MMKSLKEQIDRYESYHQSRTNRLTHYIGIPAILFGALILLSWFSFSIAGYWHISFAWIATAALIIYYFFLDIKLAALMTIILVILTLICHAIAYPHPTTGTFIVFLVFFFGGWVLQFVGHTFEKNKPSFVTSFPQLVIAPMYLLIEVLKLTKLARHFDIDDDGTPPSE